MASWLLGIRVLLLILASAYANRASWKQIGRRISPAVLSFAFLQTSVPLLPQLWTSSPSIAHAASTPVASKYYTKAEASAEATKKKYADMEKLWSNDVKKILAENAKILAQTEAELHEFSTEILKVETKFKNFNDLGEKSNERLQTDMNKLRLSALTKYEAAEESALKENKPSVTGRKFDIAQKEAAILAKEEEGLVLFTESLADGVGATLQLANIKSDLDSIASELKDIKQAQAASLQGLTSGIETSVAFCRDSFSDCKTKGAEGSATFQKNVKSANAAQSAFTKCVKRIDSREK